MQPNKYLKHSIVIFPLKIISWILIFGFYFIMNSVIIPDSLGIKKSKYPISADLIFCSIGYLITSYYFIILQILFVNSTGSLIVNPSIRRA